jgi:RNA polymerase sigma-70 factor (ECF subfamily)
MASNQPDGSSRPPQGAVFATTHWSVVQAAGQADSASAHEALAYLCQVYWQPLYAYARRCGHAPHDAQDLTQEFFARLLEGNWVAKADQQRGRFRSFLLTAMKRFMINEWKKEHVQRRGGHPPAPSLDDDSAEQRYQLEPVEKRTPESLFERGWALSLLDSVLLKLEREYAREEKREWMEVMRPALTAEREAINYAGMAAKLNMTETAARVAVHRLRKQYRGLIRSEVARTVASPDEVDEEMRHLFQVLAGA